MKTSGGMKVYLHSLLTSELYEDGCDHLAPVALPPRRHPVNNWIL